MKWAMYSMDAMDAMALPLNAAIDAEPDGARWAAQLELGLARRARGTRLVDNRHCGPLCVQRPFYPEGPELAHIYVLHPPGGMVSGDQLSINISVAADAAGLFTMPGAGRVYRARADRALQSQRVNLQVASGASLEWLPLESIVFNDAQARLETHLNLEPGARCIAWEVTSLGLPANGVRFSRGHFSQIFSGSVAGVPSLIERLEL
ncbi:MAG: urease accessory protein UreD, partial [Cellvibrionaceae bacterium]|nr:urease accessory protein UreD [Cellvibrionaceae bacterium]